MFVSPTEPPMLRALGTSSWFPERFGADVLIASRGQFHGIQRKTIPDLLASLHDGRLQKEMGQMKRLPTALVIIEGRVSWTLDGALLSDYARWTRTQHRNLLRSIQAKGCWVETTESLPETVEAVQDFATYIAKHDHRSLNTRPKPQGAWGTATNRDFQLHLLQGIPDVGSSLAERILDELGMPFGWTITEDELKKVPGIGPKKAAKIFRALSPEGVM